MLLLLRILILLLFFFHFLLFFSSFFFFSKIALSTNTTRNTPFKRLKIAHSMLRNTWSEWLIKELRHYEERLRSFVPSTFQQIRKNYGDINALVDTKMSILKLKANQVTERSLKKLFRHEVAAIRVPNFFPAEACDYLSESFLEQPTSNWKVSSHGNGKFGCERRVTLQCCTWPRAGVHQQPFENAKHFTQSLRQNGGRQTASTNASTTQLDDRGKPSLFSNLTPIDLLRLQLDET